MVRATRAVPTNDVIIFGTSTAEELNFSFIYDREYRLRRHQPMAKIILDYVTDICYQYRRERW